MVTVETVSPAQIQKLLRSNRYGRNAADGVRRMQNPTVGGMLETIDQPVYDSFSVAANTAFPKTVLFQTPIGQSGKTLAQTNMIQAGQLVNPQKLIVRAIRVWVANNVTPTDLNNFLQNVSFTLTVGKKPMLECIPAFLPAACGAVVNSIAQVGTAPAGSAVSYSTGNGIADTRAAFTLNNPFAIETGESFNVTLNPETGFNTQANTTNPPGVGMTVYVVLDGDLYRGVQ